MKKVLILSASPRRHGNSDTLCHQFAKGAEEAGNPVETISLYDKKTGFCRACYACFRTGKCVIQDDMAEELTTIFENPGNTVKGIIWGEGVWQKGEVESIMAMQEAYQTGKTLDAG